MLQSLQLNAEHPTERINSVGIQLEQMHLSKIPELRFFFCFLLTVSFLVVALGLNLSYAYRALVECMSYADRVLVVCCCYCYC